VVLLAQWGAVGGVGGAGAVGGAGGGAAGTPSSGPGGRVFDVVVDGAGGASGSPAVEGGVLPSGFSTTTLPSM
jgi:hypothetical protein